MLWGKLSNIALLLTLEPDDFLWWDGPGLCKMLSSIPDPPPRCPKHSPLLSCGKQNAPGIVKLPGGHKHCSELLLYSARYLGYHSNPTSYEILGKLANLFVPSFLHL